MGTNYQPLQLQAYEHLKKCIENNELKPGVIYSETSMAKELQISRTPFKIALARLSQEKYIDIIPSKGFRLHVFSEEDIENMYQIRTAIESFCCILLSEKQGTTMGMLTLRQLANTVEAMKKNIAENGDPAEYQELDAFFHLTLIRFAENSEFEQLMKYSVQNCVASVIGDKQRTKEQLETYCVEHTQMLNAIVDKAVSGCYAAVQQHMETLRKEALRIYREKLEEQ